MADVSIAEPDITLVLDSKGIIREAKISNDVSGGQTDGWIGRLWTDTVADIGADKVRRMVDDALANGVSAFRQVNQRFPSGLEVPIEYTIVSLGDDTGLVAVGKSLEAVAELQARLVAAQQAMERDYWKLREVETRYRLLFDVSSEAVLLVRVSNLHIIEANPAARRALGVNPEGRDLLQELAPEDRDIVQTMLVRVREQGKAPGLLVHLGPDRHPWLVRASVMTSQPGSVFLLHLSPAGLALQDSDVSDSVPVEEFVDRMPDGFVVIDQDGVILRSNRAFLDLVQAGAEGEVVGERLGRWLGRPGADLKVLLTSIRQHKVVRLFSTTLHGELGTDTEVEISAAGTSDSGSPYIGVLIRAVGHRLPMAGAGDGMGAVLATLAQQVGQNPLSKLVKNTVGAIERHYIAAALELTGGNRTSTAEILGLSRQSLYVKLNRYGLDGDSGTATKRNI